MADANFLGIASGIGELELTLKYTAKVLRGVWEQSWPNEPAGAAAGRIALGTLRQARNDLDAVIDALADAVKREAA